MKKHYTILILFGLLTLMVVALGIYRSYTLESTSLGDCPEGTILGKKGKCLKCDSRESWDSWGISSEECSARCPNRSMMDGKCVLNSCPPKTFRDEKGNCPYCGEGKSVPPSPEECAKCSNREMVNGKCVFKCNIEGPYFYTSTGICRSCNDSKNYEYSTDEECSKCPNREMFDDRCVLKCNEDEFHNYYGACISCNTDEAWNAHPPEECLKCPNRKINEENKCVLK